MPTTTDDPVRAEVERQLRRVLELTVVGPWRLSTWLPRCAARRWRELVSPSEAHPPRPAADPDATAARVEASRDAVAVTPDPDASVPAVGTLPIGDYQSLAASQVVTRLADLGPDELALVRDFETAHRGRRTILGKIDQLLG